MLQDRVHILELDHKRLCEKIDYREAVDAELQDFEENLRNESFFMIRGLTRLPKLDPKEWQVRAIADVAKALTLMGMSYPIKFIQNATGRGKNSVVHYRVKVETAAASKAIRDKFSTYFHDGTDSRPEGLRQVSVRNCVTTATLGRIAVLQLLGRRYAAANQGARFTVIGYESRPLLKIFPSPSSGDKRVMTFNYIEAISKLPTGFTAEERAELLKRISPKLHSKLREIFVVVTQDHLRRSRPRDRGSCDAPDASSPSAANTSASDSSPGLLSSRRARKRVAPSAGGAPAKR